MATKRKWGQGSWDSGKWDSSMVQKHILNMNAKVALNLTNLKPSEKLAKFQTAITKCGEAPALPNAKPPLVECQASHDAADALLKLIAAKEAELVNLRVQRDQLIDAAMADYSTLGSCVETNSGGDPAVITKYGYDVAGSGTPSPMPHETQPMNLVLTHGDHDGAVDVAWHRDKQARSTEVQICVDPLSPTKWVPNQIATKSSCTIENQVPGTKLWVQARSIRKDGPGLWSEPAFIIVS